MDDKWNGFVDDDRLHLHRSWTGRGIYEAKFQPVGTGWMITEAVVSANARKTPMSDDCETLLLESIIETVFVGQWQWPKLRAVVECFRHSEQD
jgi:hypothetical protein